MAEHKTLPFLVVDDNPIHRALLTHFLTAKGYDVEEAANGNEALEKLKSNTYYFILMDLLMPGLDGYETLQRIRAMGVNTPIIVLSALSMKQDRDRCIKAGCNDFMPKPIDLKELWETIRRHERPDDDDGELRGDGNGGFEGAPVHPLLPGRTVLLVEEDNGRAGQIARVLSELDMNVSRVATGSEALELLDDDRSAPEIVVSNVFTSGIDGLGLTTMLKRKHPDKMIFLYAPDYNSDMFQLAVRQGVHGIVTQASFESSIAGIMESALYHRHVTLLRSSDEQTARQVRQSQAQLYKYGYEGDSSWLDITSSTLHDAGGDIVLTRRFNLAGRYGIMIADVAGHDVRSSYISAIFLGIISSIWDTVHEPATLLKTINQELIKLNVTTYHVCATALLWDQRRGTVRISTAGNPGGLLAHENEDGSYDITSLEGGGMCLGLLDRNDLYFHESIDFGEGDYLFFFTDGVERDVMERYLARSLEKHEDDSIRGLSHRVLGQILSHSEQEDDIVIVGLEGGRKLPEEGEHYYFRSCYDGVNEASDWLSSHIPPAGVPRGVDRDFLLLSVREAMLNAVEHGNKMRDDAFVDVSLYRTDDELRVEVSDEGSGFDIEEKLQNIRGGDGLQVGMRGLPLIDSFSDSITVKGGTVVLSFRQKNGAFKGGST